jgi:hypothetical protein
MQPVPLPAVTALVLVLAATVPDAASAQAGAFGYGFGSIVFAAPTGGTGMSSFGGGAEIGGERVTAAAEISNLAPFEAPAQGLWMTSIHASYYPRRRGALKVAQPFVTGGISFVLDDGGDFGPSETFQCRGWRQLVALSSSGVPVRGARSDAGSGVSHNFDTRRTRIQVRLGGSSGRARVRPGISVSRQSSFRDGVQAQPLVLPQFTHL